MKRQIVKIFAVVYKNCLLFQTIFKTIYERKRQNTKSTERGNNKNEKQLENKTTMRINEESREIQRSFFRVKKKNT